MPNTNAVIADKVRGIAAEKHLSQKSIAGILDLSRTSITDRFSGRIPFTGPELYKLSITLNVKLERFFPDPSEEPRQILAALAAAEHIAA